MGSARELILEADRLARENGLSQAAWSRKSGYDEFGKLISNTYKRGDCKLSVIERLLHAIGYELKIERISSGGLSNAEG